MQEKEEIPSKMGEIVTAGLACFEKTELQNDRVFSEYVLLPW